jgi:peptidoglycan/xylan/chitin deacetylase (PgdA/CDA1 family)
MKLRFAAALLPLIGIAIVACASNDDGGGQGDESNFTEKQGNGRSLPAKTIALTFDDGPGPRTKELSSFLKDQGIRAGFFMLGSNAKGKDDVMKQVNADGHVIGNHTWDHKLLTRLSSSDVQSEIQRTDEVISPFFKGNMRMFRAPFGGWSPSIADQLNRTSLSPYVGSIFWDIGGELTETHAADWACWGNAHLSPEECGDRYIQEIHDRGDRGIILMHDIHSKTIDMVKLIIPKLKAQGFKFARVDQVPDIHKQLVANGAQPDADLGVPSPVASPAAAECGDDMMVCGSAIGKDATTLFSCRNHKLNTACRCAGDCTVSAHGSDCFCEAGEPGSTMPTDIGQCVDTTITIVDTRLAGVSGSGSAVGFLNGGAQVGFETIPEIDESRPGDEVTVCLDSIPSNCPTGDDRGRVYTTTNKRTGKKWTQANASHMCGGA